MKIAAYTVANIERASSRLRSFYLFELAGKYNIEVIRPYRYLDVFFKSIDLVHIQKVASVRIIFIIGLLRLMRIKVVYDIDDQPAQPEMTLGWLRFLRCYLILLLPSVVSVDTESRKLYWNKYLPFKKIIVINDVADNVNNNLEITDRLNSLSENVFFWVGYSENMKSISFFLDEVKKTNKYKMIVSTEDSAINQLKLNYPFVSFIPWYDGVAYSPNINAKYMILNHNIDEVTVLKSENKMVLSILAGFIPIVSRTPAYEKLAKLLNVEFLLFDNISEVFDVVDNIRRIKFEFFSDEAIRKINENYSKNSVFLNFKEKVIE